MLKLNPIASNMTEVTTEKAVVLFSYKTPVAAYIDGVLYRTTQKWSNTTTRHINKWFARNPDIHAIMCDRPQEFFDALLGDSLYGGN